MPPRIDNPSLTEICKLVEEIIEEYKSVSACATSEGFMSDHEVEAEIARWRARLIKIISEIDYASQD